MRPKLATHLSPAEVATLNVTSRSFANLNVTSTTQRHAAAHGGDGGQLRPVEPRHT